MPTPPAEAALASIFSIASPRTIDGNAPANASAGPPPFRDYLLYEAHGRHDYKGKQESESRNTPLIQRPQKFAVKHAIGVDAFAVVNQSFDQRK